MHTKDTPFALLGSGDMLALYRCYSCRYKFTVDFSSPEASRKHLMRPISIGVP